MADDTVRKRSSIAKQFFDHAIKIKLITENPFSELASSVVGNEAQQFFVEMDLFNQVNEAAPGAEWEAIIAMARIGGSRCPSKINRLRWEDIDFINGRVRIHASKTEHHANGGLRYCPLFPELRPYLDNLEELAKSVEKYGHPIPWFLHLGKALPTTEPA